MTVARYATQPTPPRCDWWESPPPPVLPHPTVFASEAVKTGLLDKDGNAIWRLPDAIGFLPRDGGER